MSEGFICLKKKLDIKLALYRCLLLYGGIENIRPPSIVWKDIGGDKEVKLMDNVRRPVSSKGTRCPSCGLIMVDYGKGDFESGESCCSCGGMPDKGKFHWLSVKLSIGPLVGVG